MDRRKLLTKTRDAGLGFLMSSQIISKASAKKAWWDTSDLQQPSEADCKYKQPPGKWQMSAEQFVSGENTTLEIRYINGDKPLPPNSYHRLSIEPLSVKSLFHCHPSEGFKIVPYKGNLSKIDFTLGDISGLGANVKISFPKGLKPKESFAIRIGNKTANGDVKAIVNPIPVKDLPAMVFSNLTGENLAKLDMSDRAKMWMAQSGEVSWFTQGWTNHIPKANIVAGPACALRVFGPTLVEANNAFNLRIAVTDKFDSRCEPVYTGSVKIESNDKIQNLPGNLTFERNDNCTKIIKGLKVKQPGTYRVKVMLDSSGKVFESNPIVVKDKVEETIYWGNIHNHNCYSECWGGTMERFYSFAKEISGFDFVSISDHMMKKPDEFGEMGRLFKWKTGRISTPIECWVDTVSTANKYNLPGEFAALVGYEWGGKTPERRGYHMNVYYGDAQVYNINKFFMPGKSEVTDLYDLLKNLDNVMFIPHKHGVYFAYEVIEETVDKEGYPLTPGIEVYSDWGDAFSPYGTYEVDSRFGGIRSRRFMSYQEAIDKGYKLCVIADSDSHTGLPGRRLPGGITRHHDHPQGITAVISKQLSRNDIIRCYKQRKTYGTTGERIYMDVQANAVGMGEHLKVNDRFAITAEIAGTDIIESVSLYDGLKLIETKKPNAKDCSIVFDCSVPDNKERPYFIIAIQKDENRAWSTPIWISPA